VSILTAAFPHLNVQDILASNKDGRSLSLPESDRTQVAIWLYYQLSHREAWVINSIYGLTVKPRSIQAVSKVMALSNERVHQIVRSAILYMIRCLRGIKIDEKDFFGKRQDTPITNLLLTVQEFAYQQDSSETLGVQ
jgi:hypothetical protein